MNSHSIHIGVVTRRVFGCVIGLVAAVSLSTSVAAEVPVEDYTLLPPTGKTTLVSLSGYAVSEGEMSRMQATPELPLYYPYKRDADWWDNLVAEQLQARMPAIMVASRGTGEGNMNPLELTGLIEALERADASPEVMKVACFLDTANWGLRAKAIAEKSFDFADADLFARIVFGENVRPWFDTVPRERWFRVEGRPVIHIWGVNPAMPGRAINHGGNYSKRLTELADQFERAYGVRPWFVPANDAVQSGWGDPTLRDQPDVLGSDGWFMPPTKAWTVTRVNHRIGAFIPGFIDPSQPTNKKRMIPRNNGETFIAGLNATQGTTYTLIEGWTNYQESNGLYRSEAAGWPTPNFYINALQRFNDPEALTYRLEAEACDEYVDLTPGNSGGKFRRSGDLDIQDVGDGNGWNVGWTQAGESIKHRGVYLREGTYRFVVRYATPHENTEVGLAINGEPLEPVRLPATEGWQSYGVAYLAVGVPVSTGRADITLTFVTGETNVDWVFVKRENTPKASSARR